MLNTAEPELAFLLEAFQLRDPDPELSETFDAVARPILRRMAKRHGWGLPKDVIEDVVQEAFLSIANPALVSFDASRGTAIQYLQGRILNAAKSLQVVHGLRRNGSDFENEPQREFVSFDDVSLRSNMEVSLAAIQARQELERLFTGVGDDVREACVRVFAEEESQTAVAADLKLSRFALSRQLSGVRAMAMERLAAAHYA
jgi:DNA-directed RNA polymerase specialized sigma24 family protein